MEGGRPRWTFLSNHAHVLIAIAKNRDSRVPALVDDVGITERRNVYRINADSPLRHKVESHRTVADLLRLAEVPVRSSTAHLKRVK